MDVAALVLDVLFSRLACIMSDRILIDILFSNAATPCMSLHVNSFYSAPSHLISSPIVSFVKHNLINWHFILFYIISFYFILSHPHLIISYLILSDCISLPHLFAVFREALLEGEDPHLQSNWDDGEGYYKPRIGELIGTFTHVPWISIFFHIFYEYLHFYFFLLEHLSV